MIKMENNQVSQEVDYTLKLKDTILEQYSSIRAFARASGIAHGTIVSALDKGIGGMSYAKVRKMCECLNIDCETFEPKKRYYFYGADAARCVTCDKPIYERIVTPLDLYDRLSEIWCKETCAPRMRDDWTPLNKTLGQCSITAFLVQDIFGGEVFAVMTENGNLHCYNRVQGVTFDLTSEQFGDKASELKYDCKLPQSRDSKDHFEKDEKRERYEYLKEKMSRWG